MLRKVIDYICKCWYSEYILTERKWRELNINKIDNEDVFSLRNYKGDLHVHTKDDPNDIREIAEKRIGSNCAHNKMGDVLDFMLNRIGLEYVGITNHSRDSSSKYMGEDFLQWLIAKGIKTSEASDVAKKVHKYHDQRLLNERNLLDAFCPYFGKRILKGIEANVRQDGELDTDLIRDGFFDFVLASVHPWSYKKKPNAKLYQELLLSGINHSKTNIIAHIGYGYKRIVHKLDWDLIAGNCIANQVALEINIAWILDLVERECLAGKRSSEIIDSTIKLFGKKVPILSHKIFEILSKYFDEGLRLSVNSDFHLLDRRLELLIKKDYSYLRVLKGVEVYMNSFFQKYGVKKNTIINQLSRDELQMFIDKEFYF